MRDNIPSMNYVVSYVCRKIKHAIWRASYQETAVVYGLAVSGPDIPKYLMVIGKKFPYNKRCLSRTDFSTYQMFIGNGHSDLSDVYREQTFPYIGCLLRTDISTYPIFVGNRLPMIVYQVFITNRHSHTSDVYRNRLSYISDVGGSHFHLSTYREQPYWYPYSR